ncbi:potassium channel, subfamily K, member 16-like [Diadema antillarum]|uniref:potassium channel, subfamily K, member 16-like n=1 Tax=Diadema antillarum TaxID=105358 RepID=UPI003A8984AF
MNGLKLFILTVVLFLYLLLGAVIFHYLEYDNETVNRSGLRLLRDQLLANFTCLTEEAISDFVRALSESGDIASLVTNATSLSSNWDFSSAFFFSGTVVTTIGYGGIAPKTFGGQLMCIGYAALGIPLTAWLLASLGGFYQEGFERYMAKTDELLKRAVCRLRVRRTLLWLLVLTVSYAMFLFLPAGVFVYLEGWTFHVAHYYSFITLTTIGFGDYIATLHGSSAEHWIYDILITIWNIFGLSYLAVLITVVRKGEARTASSFRKFHAVVVKKSRNLRKAARNDWKKKKSKNNGKYEKEDIRVDAMYSKSSSAEDIDVFVPCYVDPEKRDKTVVQSLEGSEAIETSVDCNFEDIPEGDTFIKEVVDIEGEIVEEGDKLCIVLECESGEDVDVAERAIRSILETGVTTDISIPHRGFSLSHRQAPHKHSSSQGTQT